jgi:putative nucleotidyltransferase with HDIG domain
MIMIQPPDWPCGIVRDLARDRVTQIWIVGGAVRDLMMGRPVRDWDFAVDGDAMGLARAVGDALGGAFFALDQERETARVVLQTDGQTPMVLDFALLRGDDLNADLADRDFSINAMALGQGDMLIDPLDGRSDLRRGEIRATSQHAFISDPVRLLRATRLARELGFTIEPETEGWIRRDAALLNQSAAERLRDEFTRGVTVDGASRFLQRLEDLDLLVHVVPELDPLKGVTQSHPHRLDVWQHTLTVMDALEAVVGCITGDPGQSDSGRSFDIPPGMWTDVPRVLHQFSEELRDHLGAIVGGDRDRGLLLKLGALVHDVGKPQTRCEGNDGRIHFYHHDSIGARMAASRMRALRFSRSEVQHVAAIVKGHMRPANLARAEKVTPRAIFRYFRDTGDAGVETLLLSLADHLATWGPNLDEQRWLRRLEVAELLLHHYFERRLETVDPRLPVDGNDLMRALNLQQGPEIGLLLDALREAVAAGEIDTRAEALRFSGEFARRLGVERTPGD